MDLTTQLEGIVALVSGTTMVFAVWSLWISHVDHRVLRHLQINGIKRLTMGARLVRDVSRVSCAGVLCAAALWCLHLPPDHDRASVVLKVTVLLVSFLLGVAVVMDWRWRKAIDEAIVAIERGDAHRP